VRASSAPARATAKLASDLAAEVTALDGIRTALAIGALADAEQQLLAYRRNFARGALRSEAEVLAIDVLAAQGRHQAAASAAERFILQHPRDPQAARVRAFLE
jgi:outer membrane protein assembly factor BamD (BamD/ComL family)